MLGYATLCGSDAAGDVCQPYLAVATHEIPGCAVSVRRRLSKHGTLQTECFIIIFAKNTVGLEVGVLL